MFKSQKGGTRVSAKKDHPRNAQDDRQAGEGRHRGHEKAGKGRKGTEEAGTKQEEGMVKVVKTQVFIPYTQDSELRRRLQEADNMLGEATNTPA